MSHRRAVALLLGAGLLLRLGVAHYAFLGPDTNTLLTVGRILREVTVLDLYEVMNPFLDDDLRRAWPYPPGFFAWAYVAEPLGNRLPGAPTEFLRLPAILADLTIALVVQWPLRWRGASDRTRLGAVALVCLGPVLLTPTAFLGQLDALAMLPAVVGLCLWERWEHPNRALAVGLLIGVGATIKLGPGLLVLALLPSARSHRERLVLVAAAAGVVLLSLAPFLLEDARSTVLSLKYAGLPGAGGFSLLVQPGLARRYLSDDPVVAFSSLTDALASIAPPLVLLGLLATALVAYRRRLEPLPAAVLLYGFVVAFGANFFFQYLILLVPFLLLQGRLREVLLLSVLVLPGQLIAFPLIFEDPSGGPVREVVYVAFQLLLLAVLIAGWVREVRRPAPVVLPRAAAPAR